MSVAFLADGRYVASGSGNKTIKIWDMTTGKELQTLKGHSRRVLSVAFSADSRYVHTKTGLIKLSVEQSTIVAQILSPDSDPAQDQDQRRPIANVSWGLSTDRCWITWNEHNILWLPSEYQPLTSAVWHYAPPSTSPQALLTDAAIALGNGLRRVVVFRMSGSGPYSLL